MRVSEIQNQNIYVIIMSTSDGGEDTIYTIFACQSGNNNIPLDCNGGSDYGGCVRQIIMFILSLVVSLLAGYSCYRTYKIEKRLTIQLFPLIINTIASAILIFFYIQVQPFNTAVYLFIVEVYTYFIILFGLIIIVLKHQEGKSPKIRIMRIIFIVLTIVAVFALIGLYIAENYIIDNGSSLIGCKGEQGWGSIIMIMVEIPIVVFTLYYSHKFKKILNQNYTHKSDLNCSPTFVTKHLMEAQDRYISLKKKQATLAVIAILVSFIFHIVDIILYLAVDQRELCKYPDNKPHICNTTQFVIRTVQNIAELFPHFVIPFIFWYLPARMSVKYSTIYMGSQFEQTSKKDSRNSKEKKEMTPDLSMNHQQSQFMQGLRNEDEIRQKLLPKSPRKKSFS